jgi:hypothetical protein
MFATNGRVNQKCGKCIFFFREEFDTFFPNIKAIRLEDGQINDIELVFEDL